MEGKLLGGPGCPWWWQWRRPSKGNLQGIWPEGLQPCQSPAHAYPRCSLPRAPSRVPGSKALLRQVAQTPERQQVGRPPVPCPSPHPHKLQHLKNEGMLVNNSFFLYTSSDLRNSSSASSEPRVDACTHTPSPAHTHRHTCRHLDTL